MTNKTRSRKKLNAEVGAIQRELTTAERLVSLRRRALIAAFCLGFGWMGAGLIPAKEHITNGLEIVDISIGAPLMGGTLGAGVGGLFPTKKERRERAKKENRQRKAELVKAQDELSADVSDALKKRYREEIEELDQEYPDL